MNGRTLEESFASFMEYLTGGAEVGRRNDGSRPARHRYTSHNGRDPTN